MKTIQQRDDKPFGADLVLEFYAPAFYLSKENRRGLRAFFRALVPAVGMKALMRPWATRLAALVDSFPVARQLLSPVYQWTTDPTFYWLCGCGMERDGVTVVQLIQTSAISLHTWPGLPGTLTGRAGLFGYGRLTISTCSPQQLSLEKVIGMVGQHLDGEVYHYSYHPWVGPSHSSGVSFPHKGP